jgi:5-methylcytosine-specific restriction endonuclease McrA
MSKAYISKALRRLVAERARARCEYCLTQEEITGAAMEIDHILPEALDGPTEESNLCLACTKCNDYKGDEITASDPMTGELAVLFNPRQQQWKEHFAWTAEGDEIVGLTPTGRATVKTLNLLTSA